ncbi:hypothetical protein [Caldimonas sp. KR1-144]|uniref:hypothetical protein n=1 Tax=Caldimonas sp. KR1-144 TaxID=3400911 RepID=UPI003BFDBE5F
MSTNAGDPTNWTDEALMAYVDGELDAAARREVAAAVLADAALRERVAALQAQRQRVAAAFAGALDEPVPERLLAPLSPPAGVVDLAGERARRQARAATPRWLQWGGIAASVALGVLLGLQLEPRGDAALLAERDGRLVATGALAQALASQLASEPAPGAAVALQLSFVDRDGRYCRSFSAARVAGLACRDGGQWMVQATGSVDAAADGAMRQADTSLPRAVLEAVDERLAGGSTLDAAQERAARDRGWQR